MIDLVSYFEDFKFELIVLSKPVAAGTESTSSLATVRDLLLFLRSGEYSFWLRVVETSFILFSIEAVAIRYEMWLELARSIAFFP